MTGEALQKLVYPAYTGNKYIKPDPDYECIDKELKKHSNLNLRFMWEEYKEKNPDGPEYSQFCERYNRRRGNSGKNVTMHQEREAACRFELHGPSKRSPNDSE
ncbi:hypothetical protein SCACP_24680 [Sporomusa carbonis]|uniref:hypothetical protein n=1 Tax=Sporomusa carbonis TaxID=3076075 RepID=UPI003A700C7D